MFFEDKALHSFIQSMQSFIFLQSMQSFIFLQSPCNSMQLKDFILQIAYAYIKEYKYINIYIFKL